MTSASRTLLFLLFSVCLSGCRHPAAEVRQSEPDPEIPFCETVTLDAPGLPGGVTISSAWYGHCYWDGFRFENTSDSPLYIVARLPTEACFPECAGVIKISKDGIFARTRDEEPSYWEKIGRGRGWDIDRTHIYYYTKELLTGMDWDLNGGNIDPALGVPPTQHGLMHWVTPSGQSGEIHVTMELAWMPSALVDIGPAPKAIVGCYEVSGANSMFAPTQLELLDRRLIYHGKPWYALTSPSPRKKNAAKDDVGDSSASQNNSGWQMEGQTVRISLSGCCSGLGLDLTPRGSDLVGKSTAYWDIPGGNVTQKIVLHRIECK